MMTLLRVVCSSSSMSMDSRVFRALAISGLTRRVRLVAVVIGGHLARFGLDFVADRGDGLDHAGAGAIGAGLAEDAFERLLGAFARDADQAEFVEGQRLGRGAVFFEGLLQART